MDGVHEFSVRGDGACRLTVGEATLIDLGDPGKEDFDHPTGAVALRRTAGVELKGGRPLPLPLGVRMGDGAHRRQLRDPVARRAPAAGRRGAGDRRRPRGRRRRCRDRLHLDHGIGGL